MPGLGGALLFNPLLGHWPVLTFPGQDRYAVGLINAVAGAALVDGETFTITDSWGTVYVFEFDDGGGVGAGNVAVLFAPGTTANEMAARIATAINAQPGFGVRAEVNPAQPDEVVVRSRVLGPVGNNATMAENVLNAGFTVDANLSNGRAYTGWLYVAERFMVDGDQRVTAMPGWQGPRPVLQVRGPGFDSSYQRPIA